MCVVERGCIKKADTSDNTLLNIYQRQGYLDLHLTLLTQTHPNMVFVRREGGYKFLTLLTLRFSIYYRHGYLYLHLTLLTQTQFHYAIVKEARGVYRWLTLLTGHFSTYFKVRGIWIYTGHF